MRTSQPRSDESSLTSSAFAFPWKRSSVATYYELRVDADPEPYADGAAKVVFVDMLGQRPMRIPQDIRERLR